jgi:cytosine permease
VISNFVGMASHSILRDSFGIDVPAYWMVLLASTLMIWVTLRGFKGIDRLALWLVPVMAGFVVFAAYKSTLYSGVAGPMGAGSFSVKTAISAVIGTYIAGVIIQPDYSRFASGTRQATWAIFIALGVIYPAILFLSAVPSIYVGDTDLLHVLGVLGLALPAFLLLLLGAWSSNVLCLYSSGLSIATVSTRLSLTHIILGIGIVGTAIALVPAQAYLVNFLVVLGVIIPPIGAIYVLDAWLLRRFDFDEAQLLGAPRYQWPALLAWAGGSSLGFAAHFGYGTLSGVASFDALILTSVLFAVFNLRQFKRSV